MATLARLFAIPLDSLSLLAVFLGSLAPDIDGDGAITRPGRLFGSFVPRIVGKLIDAVAEFLTELAEKIFGHRGFFHWPVLGVGLAMYGFYTGKLFLFWFGWGYTWHIIADALTVQGVPLLAPLSRKDISFGLCRTGSFVEAIFALGVFSLLAWSGFGLLPPGVRSEVLMLLDAVGLRRSHLFS
jgi:membrane-bound metal-dependent hydrolase YbcI (DUF457 family)